MRCEGRSVGCRAAAGIVSVVGVLYRSVLFQCIVAGLPCSARQTVACIMGLPKTDAEVGAVRPVCVSVSVRIGAPRRSIKLTYRNRYASTDYPSLSVSSRVGGIGSGRVGLGVTARNGFLIKIMLGPKVYNR